MKQAFDSESRAGTMEERPSANQPRPTRFDTSGCREVEHHLADPVSLLETLLDNSPDAIYFKDRQSRFVRYSKSFLRLLELKEGETLEGKTDADLFGEEHA